MGENSTVVVDRVKEDWQKAPEIPVNKEKSNDWSKVPDTKFNLSSEFQKLYPNEFFAQGRWEGEMDDLVVWGEIPKEIDGTFYRIIVDPYMPPDPRNGFTEGDGNACAIRIQDGKVSMKVKYVETERYLLEREAGRRLFGIYRNPYTHDPAVQFANDTPGNTNIIYWAGNVLALAERGLPWALDPDTLETRRYDPYAGQLKSKTFSAHPKVDPKKNELVTWGYEAKGLGTTDVVTYSITADGKVKNINWFNVPEVRMIHDAWLTENWIVLSCMPMFFPGEEALKNGAQHWEYDQDKPNVLLVAPRTPDKIGHLGWKAGEFREYTWDNGSIVHCGVGWEEDGKIILESPWTEWNGFAFWDKPGTKPKEITGSYVRWTIDLDQPTRTRITSMEELLPWLTEFPIIDDRFVTSKSHVTFLGGANILTGERMYGFPMFNSLVKLDTKKNETLIWDAGKGGRISEPCFVPRSPDSPEGDGWVLVFTYRPEAPRGEMIVLDSNDFTKPVAVVQMAFSLRDQLHGNWVPNPNPGTKLPRLTKPLKFVQPTALGPLNGI